MQFSIEPLPEKTFNPGDVQRLLPSSRVSKTSNGYIFPSSMADDTSGEAIQIHVTSNAIAISGGNDRKVRGDFRSTLEGLLKLNNFGRVTSGGREVNGDVGVLLR